MVVEPLHILVPALVLWALRIRENPPEPAKPFVEQRPPEILRPIWEPS